MKKANEALDYPDGWFHSLFLYRPIAVYGIFGRGVS